MMTLIGLYLRLSARDIILSKYTYNHYWYNIIVHVNVPLVASTNQVPGSCYISSDHHNCTCFKRHNATSVMDCGCLPGYEITQMEGCHGMYIRC